MEKQYLRGTKKDEYQSYTFTSRAKNILQERKFESMRRALEKLAYETENAHRVVKYTMNESSASPLAKPLAQPKFKSYEYKIYMNRSLINNQILAQIDQQLTGEVDPQNLLDLNISTPDNIESVNKSQEAFERNKVHMQTFREKFSMACQNVPRQRLMKIMTRNNEKNSNSNSSSPLKVASARQPKAPKVFSRRKGIERRIEAQNVIDDLLKALPQEPASQIRASVPTLYPESPRFGCSEMKTKSIVQSRLMNRASTTSRRSVFEATQPERISGRRSIEPTKTNFEKEIEMIEMEDAVETNDLTAQKYRILKKILRGSEMSKHIRAPDEKYETREKYSILVDSLVSPENAEQVNDQVKISFYKDKVVEKRRMARSLAGFNTAAILNKTKAEVYNVYKRLSQECEDSKKVTPTLQKAIVKSFRGISDDFKKMKEVFTAQEAELDQRIKKEVISDIQISMATAKTIRKPKKVTKLSNRSKSKGKTLPEV